MAVFCGKRLADPNAGSHIESEATRHSTKQEKKRRSTSLGSLEDSAAVQSLRQKLGFSLGKAQSDAAEASSAVL
ncbi:unnamed protein product [Caenorhabditis auriculariae]|uniref:Uncharacterized protein n=1 Tax=Caenorhabditis auriculariae TaxID=2777116 RepID=A0A8S1HXT9_9PELO|nr:unnamed protein product [Caenorhabditis auriculariae]